MYLTTIDLTKYSTLGSADYPAYTLFASISEVIRQHLSPDAAAVLAEPIFDDHSNEIDYMAANEGDALLLNALSVEERNTALEKLAVYADEIRALADTYIRNDDKQAKRIGQNLRYAIYVPDSADIYVVNGEPVLTGWGLKFRNGIDPFDTTRSRSLKTGVELIPQATSKIDNSVFESKPTQVLQQAVAIQETKTGFPWLSWLLGFLGLLLLLLLLLWMFSSDKQQTSNPSVTQPKEQGSIKPEQSQPISSEQPIAASGSDTRPPSNEVEQTPNSDRSTPVDTETQVSHKELDLVMAQSDSLVIPKESIETGDMQFLFGNWISITDLISTETRKPIRIFYSFDNSGSGTTTIERSGREPCTGSVKAEFKKGNQLQIQDQSDVRCPDGVYFPASIVRCEVDADGRAVCVGEQIDNLYNLSLKRFASIPAYHQRTDEVLRNVLGNVSSEHQRVDNLTSTITIPIANRPTSIPAYDRDYFGRGWGDDDGDCQDTRQEILITLSTVPVRFTNESNCTVLSGKWISSFTNAVHLEASDLDIDHQVPLKWAWDHGAYSWDAETRYRFANDPVNLLPVERDLNQSKGASGLEWLPPENQCGYIARFIRIVKLYGLSFLPNEAKSAENLWKECQQ